MYDQAEKLKVRFGSALAEQVVDNRIITIPGLKGRDPKEISEKNLAMIVQARLEEIFDLVHWEIKRSGYERKLIAGLVLTGGGALLREIDTVITRETGVPAYLADNPIAATALGAGKALSELPILQRSIPDM